MSSHLERLLMKQIGFMKLQQPVTEYRFALAHIGEGPAIRERLKASGLKDWRFDFAWPEYKFAVEVEGITPAGGRHQTIKGFKGDIEKYHAAMDLGWNVYRTTGHMINNGHAITLIEKMLKNSVKEIK